MQPHPQLDDFASAKLHRGVALAVPPYDDALRGEGEDVGIVDPLRAQLQGAKYAGIGGRR